MTKLIPCNGNTVRHRLTATTISERTLSARTGLGNSTLRSVLFRNALGETVTLGELNKVRTMLGLTWADLLDTPPNNTQPTDDAATLGSLLSRHRKARRTEHIATALGWDLARLTNAHDTLNQQLQPLGMRIHDTNLGWKIAPYDTTTDEASTRLEHLRDYTDTPHTGMLRVLHTIWTGNLSTRENRETDQTQLRELLNRKAITRPPNGWQLSPTTHDALNF